MRAWLKLLKPIKRQLRQMITRGLVKLVDTDTLFTELQVVALDGEVLDQVELFEQYGLTSHPHDDAETILLSLNGKRSHTIAFMAGNRQYRLKGLAQGEIALYDDQGQKVHLTRTGIVINTSMDIIANVGGNLDAAIGGNANINAAAVNLNGSSGDVVTTAHTCAFTGAPHPLGSATVKAGG